METFLYTLRQGSGDRMMVCITVYWIVHVAPTIYAQKFRQEFLWGFKTPPFRADFYDIIFRLNHNRTGRTHLNYLCIPDTASQKDHQLVLFLGDDKKVSEPLLGRLLGEDIAPP